jgi:hypothetical protein
MRTTKFSVWYTSVPLGVGIHRNWWIESYSIDIACFHWLLASQVHLHNFALFVSSLAVSCIHVQRVTTYAQETCGHRVWGHVVHQDPKPLAAVLQNGNPGARRVAIHLAPVDRHQEQVVVLA